MASEQFLEFLEKKMSERFWIPDEKLVFIPAWLIDSRSGLMYFKTDEGREASFPLAIGSTFNSCSDQQLLGVDNVVTMDSVSSGALLHTVRTRYEYALRALLLTEASKAASMGHDNIPSRSAHRPR
eukprot:GEMP01134350.1.p1 GENE.GEMP01134350.1~~GEMP01134350.1.p1  ORF type:complete len:126 (+),score=21.63 GEMP01134350.1:66-443(+)